MPNWHRTGHGICVLSIPVSALSPGLWVAFKVGWLGWLGGADSGCRRLTASWLIIGEAGPLACPGLRPGAVRQLDLAPADGGDAASSAAFGPCSCAIGRSLPSELSCPPWGSVPPARCLAACTGRLAPGSRSAPSQRLSPANARAWAALRQPAATLWMPASQTALEFPLQRPAAGQRCP